MRVSTATTLDVRPGTDAVRGEKERVAGLGGRDQRQRRQGASQDCEEIDRDQREIDRACSPSNRGTARENKKTESATMTSAAPAATMRTARLHRVGDPLQIDSVAMP